MKKEIDVNKKPEKFLGWLLHATIPLLVAAAVKLVYEVYFGAHPSNANELAAQQIMFRNVLLIGLALLLLVISAAVYTLVRRNEPAPSYNIFDYNNETERDMMHKRVTAIIKGANDSIVAVNAWREEDPPDRSQTQYREEYFEALINATQKAKYIRFVQIDKGKKIPMEFDQRYVEHFNRMLDRVSEPDSKEISLYSIEPVVPTTFVIVDDQYLLWQLNEVNPNRDSKGHKRFSMRAVVIADGGDFVKHFKKIYDLKCVKSDSKRTIKKSDLILS